jgi:hypothetical protein
MTARITFPNTRSFSTQAAQVVEFGAANSALLHEIDVIDYGRMEWEDALNTDTEACLSHGDRLPSAAMLPGNHNALKSLESFLCLRLFDSDMHTNGIARLEPRKVLS